MKRFVVAMLERACTCLDAIPRYTAGRWWRYGDWGCQLRLSKASFILDERWHGTGYWSACYTPKHIASKKSML